VTETTTKIQQIFVDWTKTKTESVLVTITRNLKSTHLVD